MQKSVLRAGTLLVIGCIFLCFCGFAPQKITDDRNAEVLLYEALGENELLVYTGEEKTHLYRTDEKTAAVPYAGQFANVSGNTLTIFAETDDFTAVRTFDAETLAEQNALTLLNGDGAAVRGLRFAVSDGREFYVVTYDAPRILKICGADGSLKREENLNGEIFGLHEVSGTVYVLLKDRAVRAENGKVSPAFSYAPDALPYAFLSQDVYVNVRGEVRDFSGALRADVFVTTQAVLADNVLYWVSDSAEVSAASDGKIGRCTLTGEITALTARSAVVRRDGALYREAFGSFTPDAPESTPEPEAPADTTETIYTKDGYVFAAPGTTAAKLRAHFPLGETEICTSAGAAVTGRLKTGMTVSSNGKVYVVIVPGDLNGSGTVNTADLRILQRALTEDAVLSDTERRAADLDGNAMTDAADLILLSRRIRRE